jgi:tetratricopeptide (TPR) repeat protein
MNDVTRFGSQLLASALIFTLAQSVFAAGNAPAPTSVQAKGKAPSKAAAKVPPAPAAIDPAVAAAAEMARARAEAQSLKNDGDTLFRAREFAAAIEAYRNSYSKYSDERVLYNEARALQALGRYSESLAQLKHFAEVASPEVKAEVPALPELQANLRSRVAEVTIRINQPDTQVTFRNQPLDLAGGAGPIWVDAGEGALRVTKDGFFPYERQITLRGGSSASFDVALGSIERQAQIVIKSRVPGSAISIDGEALAQAPTEALVLPGTHRVVARREGYSDASMQVIVVAGQHRELELNPLEQHPLLKQWWFWAGAAVVVAAGVTTAIVVARHEDGTSGDFSPSVISGPLSSPLRF